MPLMPNRPPQKSAIRFPLDGILSSEANVRVLRELAMLDDPLSVSELARGTGLSVVGVRNALRSLREWQIIRQFGSAKAPAYQLDPQHPLCRAIQDVFQSEHSRFVELVHNLEDHLDSLGPDLLAGWLYGSVATQKDRPQSDLDIAIVTAKGARSRLKDQLSTKTAVMGKLLAVKPSIVALDADDLIRLARGDPLWDEFVRHALPLKGPRPVELLTQLSHAPRKRRIKA